MASALLENLTAASTLAASDLFYVKQAGARGLKATGTQLLALVGTTYVPLAGNATMTGALTLPAGSAAAPSLNVAVNTGLYRYGASNLGVAVDGVEVAALSGSAFYLLQTGAAIQITSTGSYGFSSGATPGTSDVLLYRDAAATLAQRNGTNAQTLKVYGTADAGLTNYERLAISAQQGVGFTIGAETLGTGADNLDITIAPIGTGKVKFPAGAYVDSAGLIYTPTTAVLVNILSGTGFSLNFYSTGIQFDSASSIGWTSGLVSASQDVRVRRSGAGIVDIDSGSSGQYRDLRTRNLITNPVAFASLVAAATAGNGARAMITNCSHATFGTAADGGGSTKVPVYSDGTSWLVG